MVPPEFARETAAGPGITGGPARFHRAHTRIPITGETAGTYREAVRRAVRGRADTQLRSEPMLRDDFAGRGADALTTRALSLPPPYRVLLPILAVHHEQCEG